MHTLQLDFFFFLKREYQGKDKIKAKKIKARGGVAFKTSIIRSHTHLVRGRLALSFLSRMS